MTKVESAFKVIEGRYHTLADLDEKMSLVRMEVFGVLPPETKIRDLYEIAQDNGWIHLDKGEYVLSVSANAS